MRDLPSGTVTLLFTDIEGSTRLLHELGAGYAEALAQHRRLLREAFGAHGGVEVDTQGDALFFAFTRASDAVAAAEAAQQALASGPVRVRMGLHTGAPQLTDEGYVGFDLHRAARIAAAAHGGQVVLSLSTRVLVGDAVELVDLGEHRFKDLTAPERVFQLGEHEFPPIRSLYLTNLPVPATTFLGRKRELAEVLDLLARADVRLLTLTGPGGTGKTRLALQAAAAAADEFPDGVWWVPLAPLHDPRLVVSSIAQTLTVAEQPGRSVEQSLVAAMSARRLLLLLDNAEHLLPDLAGTIATLRDANGPTLLVTSRERLRLQGEHTFALSSLSERDGRELLLARAREVDSSFEETPAVGAVCRRLDDLPLALELAAARTAVFSPEQLLERLGKQLDLLRGGREADPRHETLRATIAWSYDLLDDLERSLFNSLSVFVGGCTYEAAEEVAGADPDTLQSLLDKSLLRRRDGAYPRYWMLETIREFAREQLDASGGAEDARSRHLAWAVALAERAEPELHAGDGPNWLDLLEHEHGNLRTALECAPERGEASSALRIVGAIWSFWQTRGHWTEGRRLADAALGHSEGVDPALLVNPLWAASLLAVWQGDLAVGADRAEQLLALADAHRLDRGRAVAHEMLGLVALYSGAPERAGPLLEHAVSLARAVDDPWLLSVALNNLGAVSLAENDFRQAMEHFEESLEVGEAQGDVDRRARAHSNIGRAALGLGDSATARTHFRRSLEAARELGLRDALMNGLLGLALTLEHDDPTRAARMLGQADALARQVGAPASAEDGPDAETKRLFAALRERLGKEQLESELRDGAALSVEEALREALEP